MRIVITGPTGAIGRALIDKCIGQGDTVLAICHKGSKRSKNIPKEAGIAIWEADLAEFEKLSKGSFPDEIEGKYDIFYHFAWEGTFGSSRNNMPLQIQNIKYTIDAVNLAKRLGCHTFIGAGSQAEYGRAEGLLTAQTPANPENGYGMAKLCAGQMSRQVCDSIGIKHIWTRILSVYGPNDGTDTMIMSTMQKMLQGQRASFTPGEQMWDYLYSEDAAEAIFLLGTKGVGNKIYILGSGQIRPLKEYIYDIKEVMDERGYEKGSIGIGDVAYGDKQVMYLGADITQLQKDTGFIPKTTFKEGIHIILGTFGKEEQNGQN